MIVAEKRYFNYTHRIADYELDSTVTTLYDGQWLIQNSSGKLVVSAGAVDVKSFLTISSKWGDVTNQFNAPITAGVTGRDTVSPSGKAVILIGPFRLETDQYVASGNTYTMGMPLKVYDGSPDAAKNGKLVPVAFGAVTDAASVSANLIESRKIVAYVAKVPANANDTIGIIHE